MQINSIYQKGNGWFFKHLNKEVRYCSQLQCYLVFPLKVTSFSGKRKIIEEIYEPRIIHCEYFFNLFK